MNGKSCLFFVVVFLLTTFVSASAGESGSTKNDSPFIDLKIGIDPGNHSLIARAKWSNLPSVPERVLYLNKLVKIDSVKVDGNPADYVFDVGGDNAPFSYLARALTIRGQGREVEIIYSGCVPDTMANVNLISSGLVELALYSAYYPLNMNDIPLFEYRLELTLPEGFEVVTNGEQLSQENREGRTRRVINSIVAGMDIPIVASPAFLRQAGNSGGIGVEMYSSEAGKELAAGRIAALIRAMAGFERRFGKTSSAGKLRFVFSPRGGWGYSRLPLAVVSEQYALASSANPFGLESGLHGEVHETAHFWWIIASTSTSDDWINEGLAEYSAFSFMAAESGTQYRDHVLKEYLEHIRKVATGTSIVETAGNSPDRYVNRYEKTALLLYVLDLKAGKGFVDGFMKELHARFKSTRAATTKAFMSLAQEQFGPADFELLKSYLTAPCWSEEQLKALAEAGNFSSLL